MLKSQYIIKINSSQKE